jgi:hypothetical protein
MIHTEVDQGGGGGGGSQAVSVGQGPSYQRSGGDLPFLQAD